MRPGASAPAELDDQGWLKGVRQVVSQNCDERPPGSEIRLIVVHAISLPPNEFGGEGIESLFTNRLDPTEHPYYGEIQALRVSAHFLVRRDGELIQFVPCNLRAWHAGLSCWQGRERCNDFSVGIELEGSEAIPFEAAQYEALVELVRVLHRCYPIEEIVGHSDIAPGRKTDPGPCFDWPLLHRLLSAYRV